MPLHQQRTTNESRSTDYTDDRFSAHFDNNRRLDIFVLVKIIKIVITRITIYIIITILDSEQSEKCFYNDVYLFFFFFFIL
jgi:hypothetical protein